MKLPGAIKVACLLSTTRIRRTSILASGLIIIVMSLTFLNLLVVRGILVGLTQGAVIDNRERYYSDIYISAKKGKKHINRENIFYDAIEDTPGIIDYTQRYITRGIVRLDNEDRIKNDENPNQINASLLGVDIIKEEKLLNTSQSLWSGTLFNPGSRDSILIGTDLLSNSEFGVVDDDSKLEGVSIGSDLIIDVNGNTKKVTVVGTIKSKVSELDSRIMLSSNLYKELVSREDFKPDEIIIKVEDIDNINNIQKLLINEGLSAFADIENPEEYQPNFIKDLIRTFAILGDFIGSISLAVAAITVFIIIFVNALTQKKSIGILKGIGISPLAIELSYIIQAVFYVLIGALISLPLLYLVLIPAFTANPIDFPFSDGILVAETSVTISRTILMFITTAVAGYLPAKYIVDKNTLDAILGR